MAQVIQVDQPIGDIRDGKVYATNPWFRYWVSTANVDINLTTDVVGILPVANGGTGLGAVPTWTEVAGGVGFAAGWSNFGGAETTAAYCQIFPGRIALRGEVVGGTGTIFTLPAGFRPPKLVRYAVAANSAYGEVRVTSAGVVQFDVGSNAAVSLSGISFSTS